MTYAGTPTTPAYLSVPSRALGIALQLGLYPPRSQCPVLPFDLSSLGRLRELLGAVAVLAVGGEHLLEEKRETLPGAVLLLGYLEEAKRDGAETKKGPYFLRR